MLSSGKSKEEIARTLSQARMDIGLKYKNMTPEELRQFLYGRNIEIYGNPLGPSVEFLIEKYQKRGLVGDQIWDKIIENAAQSNNNLNDFIRTLE